MKNAIISTIIVLLAMVCCKSKGQNIDTVHKYDLFKTAKLCQVFYDYNSLDSSINFVTDSIWFDKDSELYLKDYKLYFNKNKILQFEDVMAFEHVVYMTVDGIKYLYMYPSIFFSEEKDEDGNDLGRIAWHDCGILLEFNDKNEYVIISNIAYYDSNEFCSIPKRKKSPFEELLKDVH